MISEEEGGGELVQLQHLDGELTGACRQEGVVIGDGQGSHGGGESC